jgi:hypothetical protein
MTVHFRGKCIPCKNVKCNVPCETKWSDKQPMLVMRGFCEEVILDGDAAVIK